jgi:phospholipase C
VRAIYDRESAGIVLVIRNHGGSTEKVSISDAYSGNTHAQVLPPHGSAMFVSPLEKTFGWYDLTAQVESDASFQRQLAGHVETGRPSVSDPAIGGGVREVAEVG